MKIAIKDLEPNPFKDLKKYPIDKERVAKLKGSIKGLKFWKGIVCRPHPIKKDKYQLAFGHHRIEALKELRYTTISMTVLNYDDADMLLAMAEENRDVKQDIGTMLNLVEQTKKFLDEELAKYDWATSHKFMRCLFKNQTAYTETKTKGVGQTTILKFLNKNKTKWTSNEIDIALDILKSEAEKEIDREAVILFKIPYQVKEFKEAVTNKKNPVPEKKQKEVAKKVIKEQDKRKKEKKKGIPSGGRGIKQIVKSIVTPKKRSDNFHKAEMAIEDIEKASKKLVARITQLRELLSKMKVTEIKGINVLGAEIALRDLMNEFKKFEIEQRKVSKQIIGKTK